ncbi:3-oxoacyl-ACP reductase FabG [Gloeocapsa sp. PCC 73106]|uniref:3-oxoacyl-ACP reductase FabG n=1 Tax=Gloeocapsa sp. PCC 73106 TaxID=102232 RepID=UPI0002AC3A32|nr:3-oxoacyl-ACP reductase FabG [Gloeocapsa sp. PCC 73106]ELR98281.1 dehydrogenase of unknown specificity [Gloeocapsa sp. PCC 73106]
MESQQILLTGGTGGLGLGVTPTLLSRGAKITIPYQGEKGVKRLKERLPATEFERLRFVQTDLSQETGVEKLVNDLSRVDVLIHLVGGFSMGPTHEFSYDDWKTSLELNLYTTFLVCKHCLKRMRQQGYGRIVTVSSKAALQPSPQLAAYSAAKAGVIALTQAIAAETSGLNITANVIVPGVIDTPSNREAMGSDNTANWTKPESIAEVICFLVSDQARDLRGAVLPV